MKTILSYMNWFLGTIDTGKIQEWEYLRCLLEQCRKVCCPHPSHPWKQYSVCVWLESFGAVRYHVDWCTKNKCMNWIPTCGLFLTCTESLLFSYQALTIYIITISRARIIYKKRNALTWKGGPLFMVANPHPPWSLTWSQIPLCPMPSPNPAPTFPLTGRLFTYRWH